MMQKQVEQKADTEMEITVPCSLHMAICDRHEPPSSNPFSLIVKSRLLQVSHGAES